ncbi:MAG: hypothetical protein ACRC33_07315 [Gemmataceae bacterium]
MLAVVELGMFVCGIVLLVAGKLPLGSRSVRGVPARIIGRLLLLPAPTAIGIGVYVAYHEMIHGRWVELPEWQPTFLAIEVGMVLVCAVAIGLIVAVSASPEATPGLEAGQFRRGPGGTAPEAFPDFRPLPDGEPDTRLRADRLPRPRPGP